MTKIGGNAEHLAQSARSMSQTGEEFGTAGGEAGQVAQQAQEQATEIIRMLGQSFEGMFERLEQAVAETRTQFGAQEGRATPRRGRGSCWVSSSRSRSGSGAAPGRASGSSAHG